MVAGKGKKMEIKKSGEKGKKSTIKKVRRKSDKESEGKWKKVRKL